MSRFDRAVFACEPPAQDIVEHPKYLGPQLSNGVGNYSSIYRYAAQVLSATIAAVIFMRLALSGLCRMSDPAKRILTAGLIVCCCLLWFAVILALAAQPYSAATSHLFRRAEILESGASVSLFCAVFLAAFAEERLAR